MTIPLLTFLMGLILGAAVVGSIAVNKASVMKEMIGRQGRLIDRLREKNFRQQMSGGWKPGPTETNRLSQN